MKIVFFGTPEFAASVLEEIVSHSEHTIVAVVSKPDAASGRNQILKDTPVKAETKRLLRDVPLFQMPKASSKESIEMLSSIEADVYWVVAYGEIISSSVIAIPKIGCFNVHASLLPAYRGAAPVQRCLMDGCAKTGISIFRLTKGMDSGDIIWQKSCFIEKNTNAGELTESLLLLAKEGTISCLDALSKGSVVYTPQHHEEATFASKIEAKDRRLNPAEGIFQLHNQIRSLSPMPGAFFSIVYKERNMRLKVLKTHINEEDCAELRRFVQRSDGRLALQTPEGTLIFDEIQLEGRAAMPSDLFLRGIPLSEILIDFSL